MSINKQNEEQFKQINSKLEKIATHNHILETQIAQQASSSNTKPLEKFPSQLEYVEKESCQAITLRSGKEVEKDINKKKMVVDGDDGLEIEEVDVRNKNDEKSKKKSNKEDALPSKKENQRWLLKLFLFLKGS